MPPARHPLDPADELSRPSILGPSTRRVIAQYPQFDETPEIPPDDKKIYCREWCPSHPDVNKIVFELIDELIDAFEADAFHVGMDEVFLIGDKNCPRCKDQDVADLFAKVVIELHDHLVSKKGAEMLMWSDRFLDSKATGYGTWEASATGSHRGSSACRRTSSCATGTMRCRQPIVRWVRKTFPLGPVLPRERLSRVAVAVAESGVG